MMKRLITIGLAWALCILHPAASGADAHSNCVVTLFPRYGTYIATHRLGGPVLMLNGGGALEGPPSEWSWVHHRLFGSAPRRAGNVIVLRAVDVNLYDKLFYREGNFASIQTVRIPPCATRAQIDAVTPLVDRADIVFFAGGDQAHYVLWKGSRMMEAVRRVYERGGAVGGGSAGLAIQGAVVYDSVTSDRIGLDTHTADAVANPLEPRISFTTGLFAWPPLADTITDTHFVVRNRFGRLVVFLARIFHDRLLPNTKVVYGLGIDQASVVVVAPDGVGTVLNAAGGRGAYLLRATSQPHLILGKPLRYSMDVSHIGRPGERFDLLHKRSREAWYRVSVDGSKKNPYSRDPYRP